MKKLIYLLAPLMCAFSLSSCGGNPAPDPMLKQELCFTSLTEGSEIGIYIGNYGDVTPKEKKQINLEFKKNDGEWEPVVLGEIVEGAPRIVFAKGLEKGDKIYLRGNNPDGLSYFNPSSSDDEDITYLFSSDKNGLFDLSGNIMSLISAENFSTLDTIPNVYCFNSLFCTWDSSDFLGINIKNAKDFVLPAINLKDGCYSGLFYNCNELETAPSVLPAEIVKNESYWDMFNECESLISTPQISAKQIGNDGMRSMFANCTLLSNIAEFNFTSLGESGAECMFENCSSLTEIPLIPTRNVNLGNNCYNSMFYDCEELIIKDKGNKLVLDTKGFTEDIIKEKFDSIFVETKGWDESSQVKPNTQYYC